MKKLLFLLLSIISLQTFAQESPYSKLKVYLKNGNINELTENGITVAHGHHKSGVFVINDFSSNERIKLDELGYSYDVLVEDVTRHYLETRDQISKPSQECEDSSTLDYITPENFSLGSMGGYFSYEEVWQHIDNMHNLYPNLISIKEPINENLTHDGNPIYWVRISNNPTVDEEKPEMLYTALHHAREPGSVSQLIFFMYYILENYGENEQISAIVNNAELYFIPMINPDGYLHNQTTSPNGGGMWRKNRRNNGDGSFGVDLNRNYSLHWAEDDQGSSPTASDDTYRGPSPASEPETQMINEFCINHNFELALNYHSYGGLFIYPWGYADPSLTPDSSSFFAFGQHLTQHNHYTYGTGSQTVGYTVNGDSDDWMYGEQTVKNKILAMTPEAGSAFWENTDLIIPTCVDNLFPNIGIASILFPYAHIENNAPNLSSELNSSISINLQNIGLQEGSFNLSLSSNNPYFVNNTNSVNSPTLGHLEEYVTDISYNLAESTPVGSMIEMDLLIDNGIYQTTLPISFLFGENNAISYEDGSSIDNWITDTWGLNYNTYYSANSSITDSPDGVYPPDYTSEIVLNNTLDLSNQNYAHLSYYAKWEIETGWDYAQVSVSTDYGASWQALCGTYTKEGNEYQDYGQPIYDGQQTEWVQELINLDDYLGEHILIRFSMTSDGYVEHDGFYFDELQVVGSNGMSLLEQTNSLSIFPNPSTGIINIALNKPSSEILQITDMKGQIVYSQALNNSYSHSFDASYLPKGIYTIEHQEVKQLWIKH